MALNYTNPGWTNDDEPYIDADNLNDISDNLEEATELIGNETMDTTATTITGAIKELVGRIGSTVIGTANTTITSAIKAIQDKIGTVAMGTSATTITGAVKEIKDDISLFKCVTLSIGYNAGEPLLSIVQRAYAHANMPKGVPFIALVLSGAYYTLQGYWYANASGGYCIVNYYANAYEVTLLEGVWKINGITNTSKNIASTYLQSADSPTALTQSMKIIPLKGYLLVRGDFEQVSDGGIKVTRSGGGTLQLSASANIDSANASDTLAFNIGRYNGGWVAESSGLVASGTGTTKSCLIPSFVMSANQGDIIYLRGRNVTAARGNVTNGRIVMEYI